ncbi:gephyrin-like molybdotransferase Glp [Nitratidesulfovibrio sp. SRB-5]|uniref:molybdopterin molybdotransferase MoeA n=1 Tax=Nitratidesulfovibrio sp. SRB-5 TaxID=2872636 RepID=UPI001026A232|nr:gephyrin-like molybdotransferase Glp [Nitratidesulfovibrio sp. SRB-5]MBZ2172485.1 molybdopterin molybdotransferase MoeA [Nitratidesulfovibrio sp. SRB-5]RXF77807.1 molybdopterin molybdenumtransferase MoeA [Desulfovibrio sp. DS-1]
MTGFFNVLSVEAFTELLRAFPPLAAETAELHHADGRVLAADVIAAEDLPLTDRAGMDGYAVRAADLFGATETSPAYLECDGRVDIEHPATFAVAPGRCAAIVTGGVMPEGTDAVIMVEHTHELGAGTIEMRRAVAPGENVMLRGEDAMAGTPALTAGTRLRPQEVGMLAAVGATTVRVRRAPRVVVISTGDELVPPEATPRPGQVRDVNSHTLAALVRRAGCEARCLGIVPDELDALEAALREGLRDADVVLLSGGSSVGVRDLTVAALSRIEGAELLAHGVAISPGKPTILARVRAEDGGGCRAVWGLPGQVTSAQVVMFVLGVPFLHHLSGRTDAFDRSLWPARRVRLARNVASRQGREDWVRVRIEAEGGSGDAASPSVATPSVASPSAVPLLGKSGLLHTLTGAHALVRIPERAEGLVAGSEHDAYLI